MPCGAGCAGAAPTVRYFHQVDDPYSHLAAADAGAADGALRRRPSRSISFRRPTTPRLRSASGCGPMACATPRGWPGPMGSTSRPAPVCRVLRSTMLATRRLAANLAPDAFAERVPALGTIWTGGNLDPAGAAPAEVARRRPGAGPGPARSARSLSRRHVPVRGRVVLGRRPAQSPRGAAVGLGLDRAKAGTPPLAPCKTMRLDRRAAPGPAPVIEFWFSFRSPYVSIAFRGCASSRGITAPNCGCGRSCR